MYVDTDLTLFLHYKHLERPWMVPLESVGCCWAAYPNIPSLLGSAGVFRDIPFCYFLFSVTSSRLINELSCGVRSTRSKIHVSSMSSRGGLMLKQLRSVMRLALGSFRFGVSRGVTGTSRLSSRLDVPRGVFMR